MRTEFTRAFKLLRHEFLEHMRVYYCLYYCLFVTKMVVDYSELLELKGGVS